MQGNRWFKVVPRAETWLAHLSHDKQCGVESSASLGVRSPSLTFSTPTCNDYRIFYRPSSSSKPLFHFIQPLLSSTPFFLSSTDPPSSSAPLPEYEKQSVAHNSNFAQEVAQVCDSAIFYSSFVLQQKFSPHFLYLCGLL